MRVGILGGGQLSQMLALSGIKLGIKFSFYVENSPLPALNELGKIYFGLYTDFEKLKIFASQVDIITYENENIPVSTLEFLQKIINVYPSKKALSISQDRFLEKNLFQSLKIPTNKHLKVDSKNELLDAANQLGYPLIIKKRRFGYDGKGQIKINDTTDLEKIDLEYYNNCIAEEYVKFNREISLIGARDISGNIVFYDICENVHKNAILIKTINKVQDDFLDPARDYLERIMLELDYVGILTLEFFQRNNELIANEMAPRVHNSGHWTIEGSITSQFENHLRCILNLPLGDTTSLANCCMFNILTKMPNITKLLDINGLSFHDYQKSNQIGRKLGHVTLLNLQDQIDKRVLYLEQFLTEA